MRIDGSGIANVDMAADQGSVGFGPARPGGLEDGVDVSASGGSTIVNCPRGTIPKVIHHGPRKVEVVCESPKKTGPDPDDAPILP